MGLRQLTIQEAAASTNIWFKVDTEEQQRMFQEEFFKQGGRWLNSIQNIYYYDDADRFALDARGRLSFRTKKDSDSTLGSQVQILWQEEPSIVIASLAPEVILQATLNTSLNWQDTLALLTQLKIEELAKDFISDKCLRKMEDEKLASLARFLLEKQDSVYTHYEVDIVKAFVLTTKSYLAKRNKKLEYWYKFYRNAIENIVRQSQAGLYQEELKQSHDWEGLSWERRGEG